MSELKRGIGGGQLLVYGLGSMLGTGIYGLLGKARDMGLTLIAVEQRTSAMKTDHAAPLRCTDDRSP